METTRTGNGSPENTGGGPGSSGASRHGDLLWLGLFVTAIAVYAVLVGAGRVSAAMWGTHLAPTHQYPSLLAIVAHLGNSPSLAWQRGAFPTWLYLLTLGVMLVVIGSAVWFVARLVTQRRERRDEDVSQRPGLANRREVLAVAGAKRLVKSARQLRPSLTKKATVRDLGWFLGVSCRQECYASVEDSAVVIGPPRSGKGRFLIVNEILDAPGSVVTTSTRPDNLAITMNARACHGPVTVFDPQGLARGVPSGLKWSPSRGCGDAATAIARAAALCAGAADGIENGSFFLDQATTVVRCLVHAAALEGLGAIDLYRWSSAPAAQEAVTILAQNPRAIPYWAQELDDILSQEPKLRGSIWALVSNTLSALANPAVVESMTPTGRDGEFCPETFLRSRGSTLYLLGTNTGAGATANFVAAFVEDIVTTAQRIASSEPGQRLAIPLALILDESANFTLPSLPNLLSMGGGSNISTLAVFQSMSQARDRWGEAASAAIFDSSTLKIILGGASNARDLEDLSKLLGGVETTETSITRHDGGGRSTSESTRSRPILEVSTIRSLKEGQALLLLRRAKPIILKMRSWDSRRDSKELRDGRAAVEELLRNGATERRRS